MVSWLQDIYFQLGFSSEAARLLIREQGLDSPERFRLFIDKNVSDICIVIRKIGSKNANRTLDRGQLILVIAQEKLKLAVFLFHHWWRCILGWKVMGICEDIVHLLAGQNRLKDEYKDPDVMP